MDTAPILVELIQSREFSLTPWLPVIGSFIVALAALFGVVMSNKTNRRAIAAADDREWVKWKREQLFGISKDIIETIEYCAARLNGYHMWSSETEAVHLFIEISNRFAEFSNSARKIELLIPNDPFNSSFRSIMTSYANCMEIAKDNGASVRTSLRLSKYDQKKDPMPENVKALVEAGRVFAAQARVVLQSGVS